MPSDMQCDSTGLLQAGKAKAKATAPSRSALAPSNAGNVAKSAGSGRAIEDIYKKMSQLEHILARPDTYIGSVEKQQQAMWVHTGEAMVQRTIDFVPGLYKIFDEVLVNAADHSARNPTPAGKGDAGAKLPMTVLKVVVDAVRAAASPSCQQPIV